MGMKITLEAIFALSGLLLSIYAFYVEQQKEEDPMYVAACDISAKISCSRIFASEYGHFFSKIGIIPKDSVLDVPNALYACIFYTLLMTKPILQVDLNL